MVRARKNSSLLSKYSLKYQKNPRSRVFAPLAETYRKLGMLDEAVEILQKGIKIHPSYVLGYIVLANCHYDLQNYEMAYNTIRSFVPGNLENLSLQKLFARTCMQLGYLDEALTTYKNLLLLNPKDMFVAEQVKLLEDDLLIKQDEEHFKPEATNIDTSFEEDDWIQVDFAKNQVSNNEKKTNEEIEWEVQNPIEKFKRDVWEEKLEVAKRSLDDEYFHEDFDNEKDDDPEALSSKDNKPIITHTLVDLYCSQGHFDKAAEILRDILMLHPGDSASRDRLKEVESVLLESKSEESSLVELAKDKRALIEQKYMNYLTKIRAKKRQFI